MSPDLIYFAAAERSINTQPNVGETLGEIGMMFRSEVQGVIYGC